LIVFGNLDTTNFERHGSSIELKPYFVIQKLSLKLGGTSNFVTYEPGITGSAGLNLAYKFIDISLARSVVSQKMGSLNLESKYYDIRINSYQRRIGFDINFQWFIGFSIADFPENLPDTLKQFVQPNLDLVNYGINFLYSLNKKMSLKSIYKYRERQVKSAGSIIIGLYQNYTELSYSSTIFPDEITTEYNVVNSENRGDFYSIIPTVGYQYNFVRKNLHFSPFVSVGIGGQYQDYTSDSKGNFKGFKRASRVNFNLPLGYNGNKTYYGVIARYDQTVAKIQKTSSMDYSLVSLKFFIGIRFK